MSSPESQPTSTTPAKPKAAATSPARRYWWIIPLAVFIPLMMCGVLSLGALALFSMATPTQTISKPTLPVTVTHRDSYIGQGRVLVVINTSDTHLHGVSIRLDAPNGQTTTRTIPTLEPHQQLELGWYELSPWTVESGETATFSHPDYRPVRYAIP